MKEKFIECIAEKCSTSDDKAIIKYGAEALYIFIEKTTLLLFLSLLLNLTIEVILFSFFFMIIRICAMGVHLKKSSHCTIVSMLLILTVAYISRINISDLIKIVIIIFSAISMYLYAPDVGRNKKHIDIHWFRIGALFITFIYILLVLFQNYFSNFILFALLIESLLINPMVKKIFKEVIND